MIALDSYLIMTQQDNDSTERSPQHTGHVTMSTFERTFLWEKEQNAHLDYIGYSMETWKQVGMQENSIIHLKHENGP